jgi:hypothetical protein
MMGGGGLPFGVMGAQARGGQELWADDREAAGMKGRALTGVTSVRAANKAIQGVSKRMRARRVVCIFFSLPAGRPASAGVRNGSSVGTDGDTR